MLLTLLPCLCSALYFSIDRDDDSFIGYDHDIELLVNAANPADLQETQMMTLFVKTFNPRNRVQVNLPQAPAQLANFVCQGPIWCLREWRSYFSDPLCPGHDATQWSDDFLQTYYEIYGGEMDFEQRLVLFDRISYDFEWMRWHGNDDPGRVWTEIWSARVQDAKTALQVLAMNGFGIWNEPVGPEMLLEKLRPLVQEVSIALWQDSLLPNLLAASSENALTSIMLSPLGTGEILEAFDLSSFDMNKLSDVRYAEVLGWCLDGWRDERGDLDTLKSIWNSLLKDPRFIKLADFRRFVRLESLIKEFTAPINLYPLLLVTLKQPVPLPMFIWEHAWKHGRHLVDLLPKLVIKYVAEMEVEPDLPLLVSDLFIYALKAALGLNDNPAKLLPYANNQMQQWYLSSQKTSTNFKWLLPMMHMHLILGTRLHTELEMVYEDLPDGPSSDISLQFIAHAHSQLRASSLIVIYGRMLEQFLQTNWRPVTLRDRITWLTQVEGPIPAHPIWQQLADRVASASATCQSTLFGELIDDSWSQFMARLS